MWHRLTKVAQALIFTSHSLTDCPLLVKWCIHEKIRRISWITVWVKNHTAWSIDKNNSRAAKQGWRSQCWNETIFSTFQLEMIISHFQMQGPKGKKKRFLFCVEGKCGSSSTLCWTASQGQHCDPDAQRWSNWQVTSQVGAAERLWSALRGQRVEPRLAFMLCSAWLSSGHNK